MKSSSVPDHSDKVQQYFLMVLFIMLYKVVLSLEPMDEILKVTIGMKATEQYFPVVLFIILTFESG